MVKSLKVFSVLFALAWAVLIFLLVMTSLRQPEFGKLVVEAYEELTNDLGHTVAGMYNRLSGYLMWAVVGLAGLNGFVLLVHVKAIKEVFLGIGEMTEEEIQAEKEVEESMKTAKERREAKAKLRAEKLAKKIKKEEQLLAVEKTVEATENVVKATNDAAAAFLNSLKAFKK